MGIVSRILNRKTPIQKAKEYTSAKVHKDKNEFTGISVNSQQRINSVIKQTEDLQEEFRNSVAFRIGIRTGRVPR